MHAVRLLRRHELRAVAAANRRAIRRRRWAQRLARRSRPDQILAPVIDRFVEERRRVLELVRRLCVCCVECGVCACHDAKLPRRPISRPDPEIAAAFDEAWEHGCGCSEPDCFHLAIHLCDGCGEIFCGDCLAAHDPECDDDGDDGHWEPSADELDEWDAAIAHALDARDGDRP